MNKLNVFVDIFLYKIYILLSWGSMIQPVLFLDYELINMIRYIKKRTKTINITEL